jgi:hypothetical protein
MTEYEALATAEMFTDDEMSALRSLVEDLAMDQTERFGIPVAYPHFRRGFLHQLLDRMIIERYPVLSIRREHPGHRRPLRAGERMTPGQVRRWAERALEGYASVRTSGRPARPPEILDKII